jgi:hypothetical protein
MSEQAYTPGPWLVDKNDIRIRPAAPSPGSVLVAEVHYRENPQEAYANARLIAAAPDLLALAYALVDYHVGASHANRTGYADGCSNCGGIPHSSTCHVALAQAAIAKAEGR